MSSVKQLVTNMATKKDNVFCVYQFENTASIISVKSALHTRSNVMLQVITAPSDGLKVPAVKRSSRP